jgi:stage II sporulation protein R
MVKRFSWNSYLYLLFAFVILMVSWEHNRALAAVVESDIPEESIRLRILANSDSVSDQALKRHVRDAIVEQMNSWVAGPTDLEEARAIVRSRLPELEQAVAKEIARYGYDYSYKVELGVVPFPAKMYGSKAYPAGDYEAVRVTIGEGAGQNWWCVLFPPLCFVNAAKGEAVTKDSKSQPEGSSKSASKERNTKTGKGAKASKKTDTKDSQAAKDQKETDAKKSGPAAVEKDAKAQISADSGEKLSVLDGEAGTGKKKVRFYFWDKLMSWFA